MPESPPPTDRLLALELLVTHLQRDLDALNGALIGQQKRIDALERLIAKMDDRMTRLGEEEEPRNPAAERPPHY